MPQAQAKVITVGGLKGGSGRSTISTNLAIYIASHGHRVLLVDTDDQGSSTDFYYFRKQENPNAPQFDCEQILGGAVRREVKKRLPEYDYIVIDTGGRDTTSQRAALSVSDTVLVPVAPRDFDAWAMEKGAAMIAEFKQLDPKLKAYAFLSKADPEGQGAENQETIELIKAQEALTFINTPLGYRKAYSHATGAGKGIFELKRRRNRKANEELITLFQRCVKIKVTLQATG